MEESFRLSIRKNMSEKGGFDMSSLSTKQRMRPKEIENEIDERGAFIRQPNHFTTPFGEGEGEL